MKTFEEIIKIVAKEEAETMRDTSNPTTNQVCTVEGVKLQRENAEDDKEFFVFWMEKDVISTEDLYAIFSIKKQKFNNKEEMIPVQ